MSTKHILTDVIAPASGTVNGVVLDLSVVPMGISGITALRLDPTLPAKSANHCHLTHHTIPGIGGGRLYWDSLSTDADDNGITFKITGVTTGRWKRDVFGQICPQWYGAMGDGVHDDTSAIQAMLDANRTGNSYLATNSAPEFYFKSGKYLISAPIKLYGRQRIVGDGMGTIFVTADSGMVGKHFFEASTTGQSPTGFWAGSGIRSASFDCGSLNSVGILSTSGVSDALNGHYEDIYQFCPRGLDLVGYAQANVIKRLHVNANTESALHLQGNVNFIELIDIEGGPPATGNTDPHILIDWDNTLYPGGYKSSQNRLSHILIEPHSMLGKPAIGLIDTFNTHIDQPWIESTFANRGIKITNSANVTITGKVNWPPEYLNEITNSTVHIDQFEGDVSTVLSIDTTSLVEIDLYHTSSDINVRDVNRTNLIIAKVLNSLAPVTVYLNRTQVFQCSAENLLVNPSFEAGQYGWNLNGSTAVLTYPASGISPGKMHQQVATGGGSGTVTQSLAITTGMVGAPITLSFLGRATGGAGQINVFFDDCGVVYQTNSRSISADGKWYRLCVTVVPQSAGSALVGAAWSGMGAGGNICLDDMCVAPGTDAIPTPSRLPWLDLGGVSLFTSATTPTTTSCPRGSWCINTTAALGQPKGWIFDGSAWQTMGNL